MSTYFKEDGRTTNVQGNDRIVAMEPLSYCRDKVSNLPTKGNKLDKYVRGTKILASNYTVEQFKDLIGEAEDLILWYFVSGGMLNYLSIHSIN